MRSLGLCATFLSCWLVGCAGQPWALWLKPGAAPDEFGQDRYACLQGSQQPNSSAYIGQYGGASSSRMITNGGLFDACMNSKGWVLTAVTDSKGFYEAMRPLGEERRGLCSRPELQALWKKTACKAIETTQAQMNDRSKISAEEKIALSKYLEPSDEINARISSNYRQFDTKNGDAVARTIDNGNAEFKQVASELSAGGISWGDFNRRRIEVNKRMEENQKIALTY